MDEPLILKAKQTYRVPCRPVLIEVQVPIDRYMGLGDDQYYLLANANQCASAAAEAIAAHIFQGPVEVVDDPDQFTWQPLCPEQKT